MSKTISTYSEVNYLFPDRSQRQAALVTPECGFDIEGCFVLVDSLRYYIRVKLDVYNCSLILRFINLIPRCSFKGLFKKNLGWNLMNGRNTIFPYIRFNTLFFLLLKYEIIDLRNRFSCHKLFPPSRSAFQGSLFIYFLWIFITMVMASGMHIIKFSPVGFIGSVA